MNQQNDEMQYVQEMPHGSPVRESYVLCTSIVGIVEKMTCNVLIFYCNGSSAHFFVVSKHTLMRSAMFSGHS